MFEIDSFSANRKKKIPKKIGFGLARNKFAVTSDNDHIPINFTVLPA